MNAVGPDYARGLAGRYFNLRKASIYGGSNEIQRNIIAKAGAGALMDFSYSAKNRRCCAIRCRAIWPRIIPSRIGGKFASTASSGRTRSGSLAAIRRAGPVGGALARRNLAAWAGGPVPVESMVIMEGIRPRACAVEPFIPTVVIAGGLSWPKAAVRWPKKYVPAIAAGETIIAFAFAEPQGRFNLADITTAAEETRRRPCAQWPRKAWCLAAPWADQLYRHGAHGRRSTRGKRRQCLPG